MIKQSDSTIFTDIGADKNLTVDVPNTHHYLMNELRLNLVEMEKDAARMRSLRKMCMEDMSLSEEEFNAQIDAKIKEFP